MAQAPDDPCFAFWVIWRKCGIVYDCAWCCQSGSSALFRDHDKIHRLTLLMGRVQYQNWGNALPTLRTGTCYLSACVHTDVCVCESVLCSSSAICLQWHLLEKKVPCNDFSVFPTVAEQYLNILSCMDCRGELISTGSKINCFVQRPNSSWLFKYDQPFSRLVFLLMSEENLPPTCIIYQHLADANLASGTRGNNRT